MADADDKPRVNVGYALGQLAKALVGAGERAGARVKQWQQVLAGMLDGTLRVGSRTPVSAPPWVTLEVVRGGFATGSFAAAGPLQPHEVEALAALPRAADATDRAALNLHHLGDAGRAELEARLRDGCFRVEVPEEGALLVAAWLMARGEADRAGQLIETLMPFVDRLRFYPVPHPRPARSGATVYLQTVGESVASLRAKRARPAVERMNEALRVWTPLYDRAVALLLETVEGDLPTLRTTAAGELARRADGSPIADGGWPCRRYAADWDARACQLLDDYQRERAGHRLCGKPERRKENFTRLREHLARCVRDHASLSGRDVGSIRKILASYVTAHGAPGSDRLHRTREEQARDAARPTHQAIAGVLARRLEVFAQDEGALELPSALGPLSAAEAALLGAGSGAPVPRSLAAKALRSLEAPLEALLERRVVPSSESMAGVVPMLTARVRALAIADPELRRVYEAVYTAFRRRRSLLLLDLQSQVKLEELPWISAVEPWVGADEVSRRSARETLLRTASLAIETFPQTLLPNKLVKELRALAVGAGEPLPLVDELAADIFMGAFSVGFLRAAQVAARLLRRTVYARYYDLPCDRVLALDDVEQARFGTPSSPGFAALCEELAGARGGARSVARNGTIVEQAQILTTHNLAVLFDVLGLADKLRPRLPRLAERCFEWICRRQQLKIADWRAQLKMMKNTAYAWRQLLFYLSLAEPEAAAAFAIWCGERLAAQREPFRRRFAPVVAGLRVVVDGGRIDSGGASGGRRFLGWTVGRHWLLPPRGVEP